MSEDRTKTPAGYAVREVGFGYMVVLACDTGPLVLRDGGAAVSAARAHRDAAKRDGWVEALQWALKQREPYDHLYDSSSVAGRVEAIRVDRIRARLAELEGSDDG